ncbi:MAG: D-tyrosyl-tRNA(Tyr) deacylase [Planctomycetaceae bacterium]|nr:D-tyrosyl-tRNA(Tyr) deacylase [Planctomycetaceae bacterium]MCP4462533.1 D-tyrosyl-tRNA(Tyr) deacylase [Planctomycetaceae bacterium]MDG1806614.1 D-aminoacyl-tRNA deacylase [Pirellulaceae bacterium]MDG2103653.1 D-aminoacyl-tRNA deacylase [Pirellulaceae bacterium]
MRGCVQRVSRAKVEVDSQIVGEIGMGLAVLLGVGKGDTEADAKYLAEKITQLRIFADDEGKMNRSLVDVSGQLLAISQFTLYGDVRKGRRPSFIQAADPDMGNRLYEYFVQQVRELGIAVATGQFQADMQVELVNEGPVTIILDSEKTI